MSEEKFISFAGQIIAINAIRRIYREYDTVTIELKDGTEIDKSYMFFETAKETMRKLQSKLCAE